MELKKNWFWILLAVAIFIVITKQCEQEPEIKTVTKTEYVTITDTITKTIISKPETVYVDRYKTVKGKDSIVFVSAPTDSTITANQYNTKLESNNATADLKITTTGELLDVSGRITYTQENTTVETTKIVPKSGLFMYGQTNLNGFDTYTLGIDYVFKNKIIVGSSIEYNELLKGVNLNVKVGFKIF